VEDKSYGSVCADERSGLLSLAANTFGGIASFMPGNKPVVADYASTSTGIQMITTRISNERWQAFGALQLMGWSLMAASLMLLPLMVFAPQHFAITFTSGSLCLLFSFAPLTGIGEMFAHLFSRERIALSIWYLGSMASTLWAALWLRSKLLTAILFGVEAVQALCFFAAYIPGGQVALGMVCDLLMNSCMCNVCPRPWSWCSAKSEVNLLPS